MVDKHQGVDPKPISPNG